MSLRIAQHISVLLNPLFNAVYTFGILLGCDPDLSGGSKLAMFGVVFLFACVVPIAHVSWLRWRGIIPSLEVDQRRQRQVPLIMGVLSYAIGYILLTRMQAPAIVTGLMFCYAANTLLVTLINHWWKVSLHAAGIAGPVVALIFQFGWPAALLFILVPIVGLARITLKKHTIAQVTVGVLIGAVLTPLQLYFLFHL